MSALPELGPAEAALLPRAPHVPFMNPRTARAPGLMPLADQPLTEVLDDFAPQVARREALLDARRDICLALMDEGRAAADELLDALLADVAALPGFSVEGETVTRPDGGRVRVDRADPLDTIGRMVAEDWCLLRPDPASGEYRLVGAVLCFPSRWLLSEKIGRPLSPIHERVPDYDDDLAARVNRVFEALRAGRGLWRVNWLVHASCEPHLPMSKTEKGARDAPPGAPLYLRTERQTLIRLPRSGAVAFGIKTSICRLEALAAEERAALVDALHGLDPESIAYRSGSDLHRQALERLAALDRTGAGGHPAPN